ncbi:MAG: hypothetical protein IJ002_08025 [Clostridia bacterium]|nr:hypothetical protein [Clostridia bacterium]
MWKEGALRVNNSTFHYWIKVFEDGSRFGINGGRISKLMLKRNNEIVCNFDRGWDVKPVDNDTELALAILIASDN